MKTGTSQGFHIFKVVGSRALPMAVAAPCTSLSTPISTAKFSSIGNLSHFVTYTRKVSPFSQNKNRGKHSPSSCPSRLIVRAARMESKAVPLQSRAPSFELPEPLTEKLWTLDDFEAYPALVVMFICNHCPFVIHLKKDIVKLTNDYMRKGLAAVAISSNSTITHPQDGPDFMAEEAKRFEYPFPYLYDETQEAARTFGAACTPDFFLYKKDGRRPFELAYHGQFDDSRPNNNRPITGRDLRIALDCVLSARPVNLPQKPSIGCSIKWHPGRTN